MKEAIKIVLQLVVFAGAIWMFSLGKIEMGLIGYLSFCHMVNREMIDELQKKIAILEKK